MMKEISTSEDEIAGVEVPTEVPAKAEAGRATEVPVPSSYAQIDLPSDHPAADMWNDQVGSAPLLEGEEAEHTLGLLEERRDTLLRSGDEVEGTGLTGTQTQTEVRMPDSFPHPKPSEAQDPSLGVISALLAVAAWKQVRGVGKDSVADEPAEDGDPPGL